MKLHLKNLISSKEAYITAKCFGCPDLKVYLGIQLHCVNSDRFIFVWWTKTGGSLWPGPPRLADLDMLPVSHSSDGHLIPNDVRGEWEHNRKCFKTWNHLVLLQDRCTVVWRYSCPWYWQVLNIPLKSINISCHINTAFLLFNKSLIVWYTIILGKVIIRVNMFKICWMLLVLITKQGVWILWWNLIHTM